MVIGATPAEATSLGGELAAVLGDGVGAAALGVRVVTTRRSITLRTGAGRGGAASAIDGSWPTLKR